MVKQACFIAEAQSQDATQSFATRFLGCQDELHAAGQSQTLSALFDVGRADVKHFAFTGSCLAFVVGHQFGYIYSVRQFAAVRCGCGNELPQSAIAFFEVIGGHRLQVGQFEILNAIALQKEQAPVAIGNGF